MAINVRPSLPRNTEKEVLVRSRRRCCLCVFLEGRDVTKRGQVAHLNRKRDDHRLENLAWLCFEHHDEYDSRTSQSKGLKESEVRHWRDRLWARYDGEDTPAAAPPDKRTIELSEASVDRTEDGWRFPLWLVEDQLDLFAYKANQDGICLIERIDLPDGRVAVCCIEAPGNPGSSITNSAEWIAIQVCARFSIDPDALIWLEHYTHVVPEEWDQVYFTHDPATGELTSPRWEPMTPASWAALRLRPKSDIESDWFSVQSKLEKLFKTPGAILP